jgi:ubiquinone/menaquinone biosynthesis C-methylase UbiE
MAQNNEFTPALGRPGLTWLYDVAIRLLTRERRWRSLLVRQVSPHAGDTILDIGCGTGSLAILLKRAAPQATVIGLDPDPAILKRARAKAKRAGVDIDFRQGFARDAAATGTASKIVSSLVFHQVPMAEKRAGFAAAYEALQAGGALHIADYGLQRTALMRRLFRQVQRLDGFENTQPNADGVLPSLMQAAGFVEVREQTVVPTPTGSISLYVARRPLQTGIG